MNLSCPPDAMGLFRATCGWKQKVLRVQHESRFHTQHSLRHPRNGRVGKTNDIHNCLPSTPPAREEKIKSNSRAANERSNDKKQRKSQGTFMPARAKARRADCAPGPGVLVLFPPVARILMCRAVMPSSCDHVTQRQKQNHGGGNQGELNNAVLWQAYDA